MAISLYDASVASYLQTLGAVGVFMDKGLAHFHEHKIDPEDVVEARLFLDMWPFRNQILAVLHHSVDTIEAFKSGTFRPPSNMPRLDYAGLQALVAEKRANLQKLTPEEINAHEGGEVIFEFRETKLRFTAEGFVLSFSLPNFHFHATTAYDILRSKGVPIGKRHYMGALRLNQ